MQGESVKQYFPLGTPNSIREESKGGKYLLDPVFVHPALQSSSADPQRS